MTTLNSHSRISGRVKFLSCL